MGTGEAGARAPCDPCAPPGPSSTWRSTTGSACSHPPSASRAPRTWPPFWARLPRWAASTSPTRSRPCRVSGPPCSPSRTPSGAVACTGRGPPGRGCLPAPLQDAHVLRAIRHPRGCHAIQSFGSALLAFSAPHSLPPTVTAVSEAGPGEPAHPPESGSLFLAPPLPPDFSLLGIISKSLQLFFKKKRREREKN